MRPLLSLCLLLLAAGCVAPEPVRVSTPRPAAPAEPRRTDLEPAPVANRSLKAPSSSSVINTDLGPLSKPKPGATPLAPPGPLAAQPAR